ncbi:MAG: radical SAM protein [Candidatus Methanoperedens sp.]
MRVLLVQPNYRIQRESGAWGINPPLGLAYIASVLRENDVDVEILDANALNLTSTEVASYAEKVHASIMGISILTPAHNFSVDVASLLPDDILKVAGGNQATALPNQLINEGFNVIVRGEGEYTMLELAQGKALSDVMGISYKENDKIFHNPPRPPLDPDSLPMPARELLPSNGVDIPYLSAGTVYRPWAGILTSRGCPYDCYYCFKKTFGYKFRPRSAEKVVSEIVHLHEKYGVKEIDIYDDCFNFDLKRAEKILDIIIEQELDIHIRCSNGLRVDKITESFIKKMKKAGCCYIAYGIESGDQKVLDLIPKRITLQQVTSAIKLTNDARITTAGFFIFGLIGDNKEAMERTLTLANELNLDMCSFTIATPYPGTKLWDMVKEKGNIFISDWDDFHHTSGKMIFTYPDTAGPEDVEEVYKRSYTAFYFRPKYLIRQALKIRSLEELRMAFHGLNSILKVRR